MATFVVSWTFRSGGNSKERAADVKSLLATFAKWEAPADQTFHQFLSRIDGSGGLAIVETDNPAGFTQATSIFWGLDGVRDNSGGRCGGGRRQFG
jgi:hypothetical protein